MPSKPIKNNVIKIISGSKNKYPIKLEIVPNRLAVTIHLHDVAAGSKTSPCWTFLTEGMIAAKQKELLLTVKVPQEQDARQFPMQPVSFFVLAYKLALQNKRVNLGSISKLGEKGLFGFMGIGFTFPQTMNLSIPLKSPTLACLLLTKEELMCANAFGLARVLCRLGYEFKQFPYPPWNEANRKGIPFQAAMKTSLLAKVQRTKIFGASVVMSEGEKVILFIPPQLKPVVESSLDKATPDNALCFVLNILPSYQAYLVWLAENDSIEIMTSPGTPGDTIAGNFVILATGQQVNGAYMSEDGFTMSFTIDSWDVLKTAVRNGEGLLVEGTQGGMDFEMQWSNTPPGASAKEQSAQLEHESKSAGNLFSNLIDKVRRK